MRSLVRTISALALAALLITVPASAASAATKAKPAAWAKKNHLKGSWRAKDADRDGLKNLQEFKLATNPRKADTDRDGLKDGDEVASGNNPLKADTDRDHVKDGAEHAGIITAFDGKSITIRQFHGPALTATLDASAECVSADEVDAANGDDTTADNSSADDGTDTSGDIAPVDDGTWVDSTDGNESAASASADDPNATADSSSTEGDVTEVDLSGGDDVTAADASTGCDDPSIKKGAVVRSAELETTDGVRYVVALELK